MVETDAKDMAARYNRLDKLQTRNGRNAIQIARLNSQTDKLRQGRGHGVAILVSPESIDDQIAKAEAAVEESERKKKDARKNKKDAKKELVLKRINDGKAKAIVLYNEKGQPIDIHGNIVTITDPRTGEPVSFETSGVHIPNKQIREYEKQVRSRRSITADGKITASTVYPANPTPEQYLQHMKHPGRTDIAGVDAPKDTKPTKNDNKKNRNNSKGKVNSISDDDYVAKSRWGHRIEKIYADASGKLYAIAYKNGKSVWAYGYNTISGFWAGTEKLTPNQMKSRTKGLTLVVDNSQNGGH